MLPDRSAFLSRRHFLTEGGTGLGSIALAWLLQRDGYGAETAARRGPHFPAKAQRAISVFSIGGVSHVDTFDYKPDLAKYDGKPLKGKGKLDTFFGKPGNLMKSPYRFRQRGQSGMWVSDLLPSLAECADDLVLFQAMQTKSSSHTPAGFQMNTGFTLNGFPCVGSWLSYGLGAINQHLPTFVVLPDPRGLPAGGSNHWSQGFLPAEHQGTAFRTAGDEPISHLRTPAGIGRGQRADSMDLLARLDRRFAEDHPGDSALAARVQAYELAARMQTSIPEAVRFDDETAETKRLYGLDDPATAATGRNYLLARRLLERGVRFVQIFNGGAFGSPRINWDAHENLKQNHDAQAVQLDRPLAGLLNDLKRRGLLEDTLVIWSTEFGRTPFTEGIGAKGRDHHNHAFTCWLAGAGLKRGFRYGVSDEFGYQPTEDATTVYDFHATILHLFGLDHTRLTFYHNGIQRRLTDVHGQVIREVLA
jgi:hypothetical protein